MTQTLTQLIAKVQTNLDDPNATIFTTALCTAAVRSALKEFNQRAPMNSADLIDAVANQKEYEISDTDSRATNMIDVLLYDSVNAEDHEPLSFDEYMEDARLFFRLREAQPEGELILARYQIPYIVSGLDSETESTLPAFWDDILLDGATFYACQIRSNSRVEKVNINSKVTENWLEPKRYYRAAFDKGLALVASRKPPVSEPDQSAWNDAYHGWDV